MRPDLSQYPPLLRRLIEENPAYQRLWKEGKFTPGNPGSLSSTLSQSQEQEKVDLRPAAEKLGISIADLVHYAQALVRWTKAGFPERSDDEVSRLESICKACSKYVDGRCKQCSCRVNKRPAVVNKIRMATENCPLGKWASAEVSGRREQHHAASPLLS
jgi:hypothetical protein